MGQTITDASMIGTLLQLRCPIGAVEDMVKHRCANCGTIAAIAPSEDELRNVALAHKMALVTSIEDLRALAKEHDMILIGSDEELRSAASQYGMELIG